MAAQRQGYRGCGHCPRSARGYSVWRDSRGDNDGFQADYCPRFPGLLPRHKPAFTRAEEAYIQALWPIHGEVERSTVRVSLGKIFYKTNEMGKPELKSRVEDALATYRRAEARNRRAAAAAIAPALARRVLCCRRAVSEISARSAQDVRRR